MSDGLPACSCRGLLCWSHILLDNVAAQAVAGIVLKLDARELWLQFILGSETSRLGTGAKG